MGFKNAALAQVLGNGRNQLVVQRCRR